MDISPFTLQVVGKERRLIPTKLDISLIDGYKKVVPALISPTMRGIIEAEMDDIARGEAYYEEVLYFFFKINNS